MVVPEVWTVFYLMPAVETVCAPESVDGVLAHAGMVFKPLLLLFVGSPSSSIYSRGVWQLTVACDVSFFSTFEARSLG